MGKPPSSGLRPRSGIRRPGRRPIILDLAFLPLMGDLTRTQKERALWAAEVAEPLPEPIHRYATTRIVGLTRTFVDPWVLDSLKEGIRMNRLVEELESEARQRGLEQGLEKGLEKGLQRGLEKGLEQGRSMVTEILTQKFGPLPQEVLDQLKRCEAKRLLTDVGPRLVLGPGLDEVSQILRST